ncbi:MAG: hypothetical protein C0404_03080 [Verrucomicrobia bacterium]|nr:hypothetical protein [Verrucomicrobiota bacterium]
MSERNRVGLLVRLVLGLGLFVPGVAKGYYFGQGDYRWRNDNGSELDATWMAPTNTAITDAARYSNLRLRVAVKNLFGFSGHSIGPRLEFAERSDGPWIPVSTATNGILPFEMSGSVNYVDGDATTAQLGGSTTFVSGHMVELPGNAAAAVAVNGGEWSEFEYCIRSTTKARGGSNYWFRLAKNSGTGMMYTYVSYPQVTLAAGDASEAPVIVSPLAATGSIMTNSCYVIQASGSEPIEYSVSGFPAGLTFSGNVITGKAAVAGTYSVGLMATNAWGSDRKTMVLTVLGDQPPLALAQNKSFRSGSGDWLVLEYSDADTPAANISFQIVSGPSNGALARTTGSDPNQYYYTSTSGYTGPDSFTWRCYDRTTWSQPATFSIQVVPNPTASNQTAVAVSGTRGFVKLNANYAVDWTRPQTFAFTLRLAPKHGMLEWKNAAGAWCALSEGMTVSTNDFNGSARTWYYTSSPGYLGADDFAWSWNFGGVEESGTATVAITVNENTPPVANDQILPTSAGHYGDITLSYTDPDAGQSFMFTLVSPPAHGWMEYYKPDTAEMKPLPVGVPVNGSWWKYLPSGDFVGDDPFTWRCSDGMTNSNVGTVAVRISDLAPVPRGQTVTVVTGRVTKLVTSYDDWDSPPRNLSVSVIAGPSHGHVETAGINFYYEPDPGYAGPDQFVWQMSDRILTSAPVTNLITVSATPNPSKRVLVVVMATLKAEIETELARLKADLEGENYEVRVHEWTGGSASNLWDVLVAEYEAGLPRLVGAILVGNLPMAANMDTGETTDAVYWNMYEWRNTAARQIWVSRLSGISTDREVLQIKRALDANHYCRTGQSRLPHSAFYIMGAYPEIEGAYYAYGCTNALDVWPKATKASAGLPAVWKAGGDVLDETMHTGSFGGNVGNMQGHPCQVRHNLATTCSGAGAAHELLVTRGGGCVFSVGASATTYTGAFVIMDDDITSPDFRILLAKGYSWGESLVAEYAFDDNYRAMFWGDLSIGARASSRPNMPPVVGALNTDRSSGAAPLTVTFSAAATDADGSIANYEWFVNGFNSGYSEPVLTGASTSVMHTFTLAHRYLAEVQAVDNYLARGWNSKDIVVAPEPGKPVRARCGKNFGYFVPGWDYTNAAGDVWLHDQYYVAGTWGCSGGYEGYVNQPVSNTTDPLLFQYFRTGSSFTYQVPVGNGGYTLRLGFAEMQQTAAGQRLMDVTVQGVSRISGLDVFASAGAKSAVVIPLNVDVTNGMLTFTIARNSSSSNDAALNCFEVVPGMGANQQPVARDQQVNVLKDASRTITLGAFDPEASALTYAIGQPAHGMVSGTGPEIVYTPEAGYLGSDSFTFKVNDGALDSNVATVSITVADVDPSLVAWWMLDEMTGTAAADSSLGGHNGVVQGTAAFVTGGKTGGALQLSGANDMILVSPVVPLGAEWTICSWFTAPLPNTATWHTLTRAQSGDHHVITDGGLNLGMYDNTTGGQFRGCGYNMGGLSNGWHHLVAVGSGTTTRFYIDGAYVGTSERKAATSDIYAVGNYQGNGQRFSDKIDDVRVYSRALSAQEIQALANPSAGVDSYGIPDSWKIQYFGSTNATTAAAMCDADGDGMNNYAEWRAGTNPQDAGSALRVQGSGCQEGGPSGTNMVLQWPGVAGKFYTIQRSTNLMNGFPTVVATNIAGVGGMNSRTVQVDQVCGYYRVKLE